MPIFVLLLFASPVFGLTQKEAIGVAEDYLESVLVEQELAALRARFPPPGENGEGYEVEITDSFLLENEVKELENVDLWVVPSQIEYTVEKIKQGNTVGGENSAILRKQIFVDDVLEEVLPQLFKVRDYRAFECSEIPTEDCAGVWINFDVDNVTAFEWKESNVLMESCICQEIQQNECGKKPTSPEAFVYVEEPTSDWNQAENNLLESCDGFDSINSINFLEETEEFFEFEVYLTQHSGAIRHWVERGLVRDGDFVTLRFEKSTGKIFEKIRHVDTSEYEKILVEEHGAQKIGLNYFVSPTELKEIAEYSWVTRIEPGSSGKGLMLNQHLGLQNNVFLLGALGIGTLIVLGLYLKKRV